MMRTQLHHLDIVVGGVVIIVTFVFNVVVVVISLLLLWLCSGLEIFLFPPRGTIMFCGQGELMVWVAKFFFVSNPTTARVCCG